MSTPTAQSAGNTAGAGDSPGTSPAHEFGLLLAGVGGDEVMVLMTYEQVRWHFTCEQARALGHALIHAANQGDQRGVPAPAVTEGS